MLISCRYFKAFVATAIFAPLILYAGVQPALSSDACGDVFNVPGRVGPWDYTDPYNWSKESVSGSDRFQSRVHMVTSVHLTPASQQLAQVAVGPYFIDDLNYTLTVIPNHHEALYTLIRLDQLTNGKLMTPDELRQDPRHLSQMGFEQSTDCYFQRAMRFNDKDWKVKMLYGMFLHKKSRLKQAVEYYHNAEANSRELDPAKRDLYYNIGLLYFDLGEYEKSRIYANKAYQKNFPLKALDEKLKNKGY